MEPVLSHSIPVSKLPPELKKWAKAVKDLACVKKQL